MGVYHVLGLIHFWGTVSFGNILDQFSALQPQLNLLNDPKKVTWWMHGPNWTLQWKKLFVTDTGSQLTSKNVTWFTGGPNSGPKNVPWFTGSPNFGQKTSHSQGVPIELIHVWILSWISGIKICFCHTVIFSVSIFSGFIILTSLRQKWLDPRLQYTPLE